MDLNKLSFQSFYLSLLRFVVISTNAVKCFAQCAADGKFDSTIAFLTLKHLITCSVHSRAAAVWAQDIDLADSGTPQLFCHLMWISSSSNTTYLLWWQLLQYGFPESSSMATICHINMTIYNGLHFFLF